MQTTMCFHTDLEQTKICFHTTVYFDTNLVQTTLRFDTTMAVWTLIYAHKKIYVYIYIYRQRNTKIYPWLHPTSSSIYAHAFKSTLPETYMYTRGAEPGKHPIKILIRKWSVCERGPKSQDLAVDAPSPEIIRFDTIYEKMIGLGEGAQIPRSGRGGAEPGNHPIWGF